MFLKRILLTGLLVVALASSVLAIDYSSEFQRFKSINPTSAVTLDEFNAISGYKNMNYTDINYFLRTGEWYNLEYPRDVALLKSGILKLKKFSGITFRGASFEDSQELYRKYTTVGTIVSDPAYLSTSVDRKVAESFITDSGEENLVLFVVHGNSGRDLAGIGSEGIDLAEKEILYRAGTSFKIKSAVIENITYVDYGLEDTQVMVVNLLELSEKASQLRRIFSAIHSSSK